MTTPTENRKLNLYRELIDFIRGAFDPEEIFDEEELERWAENYGYVYPDSGNPDTMGEL